MPQLSSNLSTPAGLPAINAAHIGKFGGLHLHFPTRSAWQAAIADAPSLNWADGQPMTIADEADTSAVRIYRTSLAHARTVQVGVIRLVLPADSNIVRATSGAPASGVGDNGDAAVDSTTGAIYSKSGGAWSAVTGGTVPALSITGTPPTTANIGTAYSFTPSAAGGIAPRTFAIQSGTLPAGLSINASTGAITGTPTTAGASAGIVIRVTDAASATADLAAFTITVSAAPVAVAIAVQSLANVTDEGSGVYAGTSAATSSQGRVTTTAYLAVSTEGWAEFEFPASGDAAASIGFDTVGTGTAVIQNDNDRFMSVSTAGLVSIGANAAGVSTGVTLTGASGVKVRVRRDSGMIFRAESSTDGGSNWTTIPTSAVAAWANALPDALYLRFYTTYATTPRKLYHPKQYGLATA